MKPLLLVVFCVLGANVFCQNVICPENPIGERVRDISYFQIVGKIGGHILVYENEKTQNFLQVYDDSMKVIRNIKLTFHPEKFLFTKFIDYPDFAWMIYVYRRNNLDFFVAAKINADGEVVGEPKVLDTTHVSVGATFFFNILTSNDKSKILIYKDHRQLDRVDLSNLVFNSDMQLIHHSENVTYYNKNEELFENFTINNEGDWIFTREKHSNIESFPRSEILNAQLYIQYHNEDTFRIRELPLEKTHLQTLSLNVDNLNKNIILNSLYSSNWNIAGIYTAVWNESDTNWSTSKVTELGKTIRGLANPKGSAETALNDYYIRQVLLKNDGGFIVAAEQRKSIYSTPNPDIPDRSPSSSLYDTYHQDSRQFLGSPKTEVNTHDSAAEFGNILVLDADSSSNLQWGNVVPKNQFGDLDLGWIGFASVYRGDMLNFIYNEPYKQTWLLQNQSVTSEGKVSANPLMRGLQNKYIFMPSRGRQVGTSEFIIPVIHRSNLCFAKVNF